MHPLLRRNHCHNLLHNKYYYGITTLLCDYVARMHIQRWSSIFYDSDIKNHWQACRNPTTEAHDSENTNCHEWVEIHPTDDPEIVWSQISYDAMLSGTSKLIPSHGSSNIYKDEKIHRPISIPSIYCDGRGSIFNFQIGSSHRRRRINLIYSKGGTMRSGDIRAVFQHDYILSGRVCIWMLLPSPPKTYDQEIPPCHHENSRCGSNQSISHKRHTYNGHNNEYSLDLFGADHNSSVLDRFTVKKIYTKYDYIVIPRYTPHIFEFMEDTVMIEWWDGPFLAWYYRPYRAIVDRRTQQQQQQQQSIPSSNSSLIGLSKSSPLSNQCYNPMKEIDVIVILVTMIFSLFLSIVDRKSLGKTSKSSSL
jgi:hypothetical protein